MLCRPVIDPACCQKVQEAPKKLTRNPRSWKSFTKKFVEFQHGHSKFKELTQTLETKRVFVRYVGHEIRTPLNIVLAGLNLLSMRAESLGAELAEIVDDSKNACAAAVDILNDLLTYEKLDGNLLVLDRGAYDALDIVRGVHKMFAIQARFANITTVLDNRLSAATAPVDADSAKISQVLRNLVSNALKFTPSGGSVTLVVSLAEGAGGPRVRVEVRDTGAGMAVEDRRRLFNEVVQFNAKELQGGQGSGLGLYLSRRIVDMHGGSIGVDLDWTGPGSIFFLELPLAEPLPVEEKGT